MTSEQFEKAVLLKKEIDETKELKALLESERKITIGEKCVEDTKIIDPLLEQLSKHLSELEKSFQWL